MQLYFAVKARIMACKMFSTGNCWKQHKPAIHHQQKIYAEFDIKNTDRTTGTIFQTK